MELMKLTALELGEKIKAKEISVREALDAVSAAKEKTDAKVNAYTDFDKELSDKEADRIQKLIDAGDAKSPLAGVPIGIKDNISTKGMLTTCASKILTGYKPAFDATAVSKVRDAGMVVTGKLNMDEFAMGSTSETSVYGPVKNPWDTGKVPGGSSGGAAAAVAACEAVVTLGSDTGGSIRQPASYCGVTGFKPSYGAVSRYGLIAYASSLDQIGPIAKDVRDCAAVMDVISGGDVNDSTSNAAFASGAEGANKNGFLASLNGDVKGLKVGVPAECFGEGVDPKVEESVKGMIKELESAGAVAVPISLDFIRFAVPTYYIIATAEASSNLSRFDGVKYGYRAKEADSIDDLFINSRSEGFGGEVKKRIMLGTFVLSSGYYDAYYNKALKMKQMIMDGFAGAFGNCDVIVCPTAPMTAPKIGESLSDPMKMYLSDIFTVSLNLAGLPGLSVPCGFDAQNMPIGAQIIGPAGGDLKVLNAGHAFQLATDHHKKFPEVG
ncbi:MAG: Asp-tRNA(Asn)/Glu-tRNA(Gln) amidotransferase subunit GatA [Lachnospiraceae bacterium]|nr:Asp-tRNA(Asn)/Glu-tRNA(Gln) amidotransferase subunit GatA [Lachnospiraceae bacterium]